MPDATERSAASGAPPSHVTPMTSGIAQTANATRLVSSDAARVSRAVAGAAVTSDRDAPETAVAVLVVEDGLVELAPAEVGPEHRRHEELGVRELPEEEIGDPLLAGGPDQEVGVGAVAREELAAEGALVDLVAGEPAGGDILREEPGRAHELGARTIGDEEIQPELRAERRLPDHALHRRGGGGREALQLAEHAHLHSLPLELVRLPLDVLLQERHQRRNLARGPLPVLLREGEEREHLEPHLEGPFHHLAHRLHPAPVPQGARQPALARPASVAIHDDGDVARRRAVGADLAEEIARDGGSHHTSMISCSFAFINWSILAMYSSCIFCRSFSACLTSSSETPSSFLRSSRACVRACRTAMCPSSAYLCTTFVRSRRRSSVIAGSGTRITPLCVTGSNPSPESRIAFSITLTWLLSNGVTRMRRGSGAATCATCFIAICAPYISTRTVSSIVGDALPDRTEWNSRFTASTPFSIPARQSFMMVWMLFMRRRSPPARRGWP